MYWFICPLQRDIPQTNMFATQEASIKSAEENIKANIYCTLDSQSSCRFLSFFEITQYVTYLKSN